MHLQKGYNKSTYNHLSLFQFSFLLFLYFHIIPTLSLSIIHFNIIPTLFIFPIYSYSFFFYLFTSFLFLLSLPFQFILIFLFLLLSFRFFPIVTSFSLTSFPLLPLSHFFRKQYNYLMKFGIIMTGSTSHTQTWGRNLYNIIAAGVGNGEWKVVAAG